jgi:homocysteine S-methyltransferase
VSKSLQSAFQTGELVKILEVVPPAGPDAGPVLTALQQVAQLAFHGYSVATNPVAKPRMSALALCALIQQHTDKPATLHCTTRDHNRLSLQGLLWGARALGIDSVLCSTGDHAAAAKHGLLPGGEGQRTSSVRDVDVFGLIRMAREAGLYTGVVLDPRPEVGRLDHEIGRLEKKAEAGAQYVITQPVYTESAARELSEATRHLELPVILGILPLRTGRHARFLDTKVAGIAVPEAVCQRMEQAADPVAEGLAAAREMLSITRGMFAGACLMPAFGHYEAVGTLLS